MEKQLRTWELKNGLKITNNTIYDYWEDFEIITSKVFMDSIKANDPVIIDIGAQWGHFALHAALKLQQLNAYGSIIAFEPVTRNAKQLLHNFEQNFNEFGAFDLEVFEEAIGSDTGATEMFLYRDSDSHGMHQHPTGIVESKITVPIITFDYFIERENIPPEEISLIKMDIEGNEVNALRGMPKFLDNSNNDLTLITELSPLLLHQANENIVEYIRILSWYFRNISVIDEKEGKIKGLTDEWFSYKDNGSDRYCNLYCTK
jgi:FkbM family methyltransferase